MPLFHTLFYTLMPFDGLLCLLDAAMLFTPADCDTCPHIASWVSRRPFFITPVRLAPLLADLLRRFAIFSAIVIFFFLFFYADDAAVFRRCRFSLMPR